jgi:hypothetical protein
LVSPHRSVPSVSWHSFLSVGHFQKKQKNEKIKKQHKAQKKQKRKQSPEKAKKKTKPRKIHYMFLLFRFVHLASRSLFCRLVLKKKVKKSSCACLSLLSHGARRACITAPHTHTHTHTHTHSSQGPGENKGQDYDDKFHHGVSICSNGLFFFGGADGIVPLLTIYKKKRLCLRRDNVFVNLLLSVSFPFRLLTHDSVRPHAVKLLLFFLI